MFEKLTRQVFEFLERVRDVVIETPSPEDRREFLLRKLRAFDRDQSQAALLLWAPLIPDEKLSEAQAALTIARRGPPDESIEVEPARQSAPEPARTDTRADREREASEYARVIRGFLLYHGDDILDHLPRGGEERQSLIDLRRIYRAGAMRAAGVADDVAAELQRLDLTLIEYHTLLGMGVELSEVGGAVTQHDSELLAAYGYVVRPGTSLVGVFRDITEEPFAALLAHRRKGAACCAAGGSRP